MTIGLLTLLDNFQFVKMKTEYENGLQIAYQVHAVSEMMLLFYYSERRTKMTLSKDSKGINGALPKKRMNSTQLSAAKTVARVCFLTLKYNLEDDDLKLQLATNLSVYKRLMLIDERDAFTYAMSLVKDYGNPYLIA